MDWVEHPVLAPETARSLRSHSVGSNCGSSHLHFVAAWSWRASSTAHDEPEFPGKGLQMAKIKSVFLPDSVTIASNVSHDQQAATVLIEKLQVSLGGVPGPLTVTRTATVLIPFDEANSELMLDQQVRGFADIQPGARGLLLVQLGGNTFQVDLPSPDAEDKNFVKLITSKLPKGALIRRPSSCCSNAMRTSRSSVGTSQSTRSI